MNSCPVCGPLGMNSENCPRHCSEVPATPITRYLNLVDGKVYLVVSADQEAVSFQLESGGKPHYLGRSEFDKRFQLQNPPPSSHVVGETTTSFRIEWIAAARPPAHPNPMTGKAWVDSFDDAIRHMKSQASDAQFVSLTEVVTTVARSDRSTDLRSFLSATATEGE